MDEQIKQQERILKALISVKSVGVKDLLKRYGYKISDSYSNNDLYAFLIVGISKSSAFTEDVFDLLRQSSQKSFLNADNGWSSDNTANVISAGLQAVGMVTSTWMNVAKTKADTSKYNTTYTVDGKKDNTVIIAAVVIGGIVLLGIFGVIIANKKSK